MRDGAGEWRVEAERGERAVGGFCDIRIQEAEVGGEGLRPAWTT